jgi:hypothetical protein
MFERAVAVTLEPPPAADRHLLDEVPLQCRRCRQFMLFSS